MKINPEIEEILKKHCAVCNKIDELEKQSAIARFERLTLVKQLSESIYEINDPDEVFDSKTAYLVGDYVAIVEFSEHSLPDNGGIIYHEIATASES